MEKGCIQLYYGDGKGKTTAAMGQVVRCVGHGFKVLVYQFLKEPLIARFGQDWYDELCLAAEEYLRQYGSSAPED